MKGILFSLFLFFHLSAQALSPDQLTGWEHGVSIPSSSNSSSPVIFDVDQDLTNGREIVAVSRNGTISVFSANGSLLWRDKTPNADCSLGKSKDRVHSSPGVAARGDGTILLALGYGGLSSVHFSEQCGAGVVGYNAATGQQYFNAKKKLRKIAKKKKLTIEIYSFFSSPALVDVNGDGLIEIGIGGLDRNVYLLDSNGNPRFHYHAADTVFSSPTFANINEDPDLEMFIGTDITKNTVINPPTNNGGMIYALSVSQGQLETKKQKSIHGFRDASAMAWSVAKDQTMQSSPVIADVISTNDGDELIIGSGCFFGPNGEGGSGVTKRGREISIHSATTGALLKTIPLDSCLPGSPAIADVNGSPYIFALVSSDPSLGGDGLTSKIVAIDAEAGSVVWETVPYHEGQNDSFLGLQGRQPVVADLNGDGALEVVFTNRTGVTIVDAETGEQLSCDSQNCDGKPTLSADRELRSTPAIGDIDNDGDLELVVVGGKVFVWTDFANVLPSKSSDGEPYAAPFPMWRKDAQNSGS